MLNYLLRHKADRSKEFRVIKVFPTTTTIVGWLTVPMGVRRSVFTCVVAKNSTLRRFTSNDEGRYEVTDLL